MHGFLPHADFSTGLINVPAIFVALAVTWLLMIGTILLVVGFGTSERLASAYGIALSQAMLVTTLLLFYAATRKWGWSTPRTLALISVQLVLNLVFVYSNSLKFFDGGWVPVVVLANMSPENQIQMLDQCTAVNQFVVADTMDLWISIANERLHDVLARIDLLVIR